MTVESARREGLQASIGARGALLDRVRGERTSVPATGPVVLAPSWVLAWQDGRMALLRDHEVVVEGDRVLEVRPRRGSVDQRVDMHGQVLVPGFISMHGHAAGGAATRG